MQDLEPNGQRAQKAITLLWIVLGLEVVMLISGYLQYSLLWAITGGDEVSTETLNENDLRETIIAIIYFIAYIVSAVTFLLWFKRAYSNLHKKVTGLPYTAGWAVGSWFVPIINLYRPYIIMKKLYCETKKLVNNETLSTRSLGWWWAFWLIGGFINNIGLRYSLKVETVEELMASTTISMIGNIIGIPLALITIKVVKDYSEVEPLLNISSEEQPGGTAI